jgi:hypothetical protein
MESGMNLSGSSEKRRRGRDDVRGVEQGGGIGAGVARRSGGAGERVGDLPASVRASVEVRRGEYDARRLRSQREVIRDAMLAAAECDTWLTLSELRALTRYGEASISAQLRHLRKMENGGYEVAKRRREIGARRSEERSLGRVAGDGRGERLWEYHVVRAVGGENLESHI